MPILRCEADVEAEEETIRATLDLLGWTDVNVVRFEVFVSTMVADRISSVFAGIEFLVSVSVTG